MTDSGAQGPATTSGDVCAYDGRVTLGEAGLLCWISAHASWSVGAIGLSTSFIGQAVH
jgi:hypothetical protein